jgi:hypothetical protein
LQGVVFANKIDRKTKTYLMNEAMVGTADRNKEKLYENEELQAELRQRVGDDPSALAFEAQGLNLTTTHLGFILAGRNHVERVIDEDIDAEFVEAHGKDLSAKNADPADYERRRKIALETVRLSSDDSLTGRECVSRTLGSARESAMHATRWKEAGANILGRCCHSSGSPSSLLWYPLQNSERVSAE